MIRRRQPLRRRSRDRKIAEGAREGLFRPRIVAAQDWVLERANRNPYREGTPEAKEYDHAHELLAQTDPRTPKDPDE